MSLHENSVGAAAVKGIMAGTLLMPAARGTSAVDVAGRLRAMIVTGELRAGSRLSTQKLSAVFDVPRPALRDALKLLAIEGLVRVAPNRSAVVARATLQKVDELLPVLGTLEALAGEIACARMHEEGLTYALFLRRRSLEHYRDGDLRAYLQADAAIRTTIFEEACNATLSAVYHTLCVQLLLPLDVSCRPAGWDLAVEEQGEMLAALQARDVAGWARIARPCLRHRTALLRALCGGAPG
jgi:DNA-binding GntR family transcriptional regulator